MRSCLDSNPCSKKPFKGRNKLACTTLSYTHPYTCAWHSKGYCHYPQETTSCTRASANHATATSPRWEEEPILPPRAVLHWTSRGAGMPKLHDAPFPCHFAARHKTVPAASGCPALKASFLLLFKHAAPSHERRCSCLQKVSVRGPWSSAESAAFISQPSVWGCFSLAADSVKHRARAR